MATRRKSKEPTLADEIQVSGEGQVRALITVAGNPVLSTPDGRRLANGRIVAEFPADATEVDSVGAFEQPHRPSSVMIASRRYWCRSCLEVWR